MKAVRFHEFGDPSVLRYEDVPDPTPGETGVIVKLGASGVNFIDTYQRSGAYAVDLPFVAGQEGAGEVVETGSRVTDVVVGDRVAYTGTSASYAEFVRVDADRIVRLPDEIDLETGAAVLLQGMTAHYLATSCFPLEPGHTCLVHAAAGGVGLLLTQIAKSRGATVIATVSTEEKATLAKEAGADEVILYSQVDFATEVKRIMGGQGLPVVYDSVGRDTFDGSVRCLAPRGYLVLFGQSSGRVPPVDPQILNSSGSLFLTRPSLAHYNLTREELDSRASDLFRWIGAGQLRIRIGASFPLADAADAHRDLESRKTTGKVVLVP